MYAANAIFKEIDVLNKDYVKLMDGLQHCLQLDCVLGPYSICFVCYIDCVCFCFLHIEQLFAFYVIST